MNRRYKPIADNKIPEKVCNENFSLNSKIPSIATSVIPPMRSAGITTDTPGPIESALKEISVKSEMSTPPIKAKNIPLGSLTIFLEVVKRTIAVRNAPNWNTKFAKMGSLSPDPSFLNISDIPMRKIAIRA